MKRRPAGSCCSTASRPPAGGTIKKTGISDGWKVEDGALVRKGAGAGDIVTADQYDSFELSIEYKISKGGNSGIMFHVTEELDAPWQTGPEIQVQDNVDGHDPAEGGLAVSALPADARLLHQQGRRRHPPRRRMEQHRAQGHPRRLRNQHERHSLRAVSKGKRRLEPPRRQKQVRAMGSVRQADQGAHFAAGSWRPCRVPQHQAA